MSSNQQHYKDFTFNKQQSNSINSDHLSQSFNQIEQNGQKQRPQDNRDYVNLDEEDGVNNNINIYNPGRSFFSAQSKDKADKEEVVVNISNLDIERDTQQHSIIENMNDINEIVKDQHKNQEKNDLISFENKISMPELLAHSNDDSNSFNYNMSSRVIIGIVSGLVFIVVVIFLIMTLINK